MFIFYRNVRKKDTQKLVFEGGWSLVRDGGGRGWFVVGEVVHDRFHCSATSDCLAASAGGVA